MLPEPGRTPDLRESRAVVIRMVTALHEPVLKGHGFTGCGKTRHAGGFERARLQPCRISPLFLIFFAGFGPRKTTFKGFFRSLFSRAASCPNEEARALAPEGPVFVPGIRPSAARAVPPGGSRSGTAEAVPFQSLARRNWRDSSTAGRLAQKGESRYTEDSNRSLQSHHGKDMRYLRQGAAFR